MDQGLLILTGTQRGQVLELAQSPFSVGRHPLCHFRPACPLVSRPSRSLNRRIDTAGMRRASAWLASG